MKKDLMELQKKLQIASQSQVAAQIKQITTVSEQLVTHDGGISLKTIEQVPLSKF